MKLHKCVDTSIMVIAALHVVLGLIFFGDWLVDIFRAGVGNLNWTTEALASFWFLIFAWPLFLRGYVTQWAYWRTGPSSGDARPVAYRRGGDERGFLARSGSLALHS